jgi:inorganic triphosphatase YgiF
VSNLQLKLVMLPQQLPSLRLVLEKAGAKAGPEPLLLTRTYYDSSDLKLRQQNLSFSVLEEDERHVQTLTGSNSAAGGVLAGGDCRDPIAANRPDLWAPETGPCLRAVVGDELHPLFRSQVRRTVYKVDPDSSAEIAAVLDEGEIHAVDGGAAEPVSRLKLELKRGDPALLFEMALQLLDGVPLRLEAESQPERGYRLAGAALEAVMARPLALEPSMTVEAVLQSVGRECFDHLLRNEPAAIAGGAEAFHQMRVALRRLRSALNAVRSMLPTEQYRWLKDELKWLAGKLGPARDWDVFVADLLSPVPPVLLADANLDQLTDAARARQRAAHDIAREAIESRRYAEAMLKLRCWFEARGWRDQRVSEHSAPLFAAIADVAPPLIERRWRHARTRSRHFGKLSPGERHEVRIALKKLRYMTEFLGGLFDANDVNALMKPLKRLQEDLGHLADVRTAQRLIKEIDVIANDDARGIGQYAGMIVGWHMRGLADAEPKLRRDVRRLRRVKPFWRPMLDEAAGEDRRDRTPPSRT